MGISTEQWRSVIGTFSLGKCKQTDQREPVTLIKEDQANSKNHIPKGPWKLYMAILILSTCTILSPSFLTPNHTEAIPKALYQHPSTSLSNLSPSLPYPCRLTLLLISYMTIVIISSCTILCYSYLTPNHTESTSKAHYQAPSVPSLSTPLSILSSSLPHPCRLTLLLISGIESNPGPTLSPDDVIADLCVNAPSTEIRDCIRIYRWNQSNKINQNELKRKNHRATIEATLNYLSPSVISKDYTVEGLISLVVSRINTLLPKTCQQCSESYSSSLTDEPLLCCEACGQGAHTSCILNTLQIPDEERDAITPADVLLKINPLSLPQLQYICHDCTTKYLPDKSEGLKKSLKNKQGRTDSVSVLPDDHIPPSQLHNNADDPDLNNHDNHEDDDDEDDDTGADDADARMTDDHANTDHALNSGTQHHHGNTPVQQVCRFYEKGTCRYGIAGRGCSRQHPKACKKLLQHGDRGPRGCSAGSRCDKFHPLMCRSSLRKRECFNQECKLVHTVGTKRFKPRNQDPVPNLMDVNIPEHGYSASRHQSNPSGNSTQNSDRHHQPQTHNSNYYSPNSQNSQTANTQPPSQHQNSFLEETLRTMRAEMQEIRNRIPDVRSQTPPTAQQQPQVNLQYMLSTLKQEIIAEMNARLAPYPPPRNPNPPTQPGELASAAPHHGGGIPASYQMMAPGSLPH